MSISEFERICCAFTNRGIRAAGRRAPRIHCAEFEHNRRFSNSNSSAPAYLAKVLQALVKAEIVASHRGASGGVSLARSADDLTILDIVNATDPIQRIRTCPLDLASHGLKLCPLHRRLDAALAQVENAFRNTTLAEVLGDRSRIKPLCESSSTAAGQNSPRRRKTRLRK